MEGIQRENIYRTNSSTVLRSRLFSAISGYIVSLFNDTEMAREGRVKPNPHRSRDLDPNRMLTL